MIDLSIPSTNDELGRQVAFWQSCTAAIARGGDLAPTLEQLALAGQVVLGFRCTGIKVVLAERIHGWLSPTETRGLARLDGGEWFGDVARTGEARWDLPLAEASETTRAMLATWFGELAPQSCLGAWSVAVDPAEILGLLVIVYRDAPLEPIDQGLAAVLAGQAAIAVRQHMLATEAVANARRLATLNEIGRELIVALELDDLQPLYARVHELVGVILAADVFFIALYDGETNLLQFPYACEAGEVYGIAPLPPGSGPTGTVIRTHQPLVFNNADELHRMAAIRRGDAQQLNGSAVYVPMLVGERVIGVISTQSRRDHAYQGVDVDLLGTIASRLAVTVENARLYQELRRRFQRLSILHEVALAATSSFDFDQVIREMISALQRSFGFENVGVALLSERGDQLAIHPASTGTASSVRDHAVALGDGVIGWVAQTGLPARIDDVRADTRLWMSVPGIRSALCVPLKVEDRTIGVINVESRQPGAFSLEDEQLMTIVAGQLAPLVDRARLYSESQLRVAELTALQDISTRLTLSLELSDVLDAVTSSVMRLVRPSDVHIYLWDHLTEEFTFGTALWADGSHRQASHPRRDGLTAHIVRGAAPVIIDDAQNHPFFAGPQERQWGLRSIAGFPLVHAGEVIGAFTLAFLEPHAFTPDELRLLGIFADHASIAVRNAALFDEARRRAAELATLQRSSLELTSSLDLRTVLDSITENALRLVQARDVHLYVYDDELGEFTLGVARWDINVSHAEVHIPRKEGLTAMVVRERRPIIIDDTEGHPAFSNPEAQRWGIRSIAGFPLKRAERLLGVFNIAFLTAHRFTPDELRVLTLLGDQAAVAIDNARLYEEARLRAEQVSALLETTMIISSTMDLDVRLNTIAERSRNLIAADGCAVYLLEDDGVTLRPLVALDEYQQAMEAFQMQIGEGLTGRVAQTGVGEIINHAQNDPSLPTIPGTPEEPECLVSVPLLVQQRVIGVMTLRRIGEREFQTADLQLLSSFASQAAIAIENAKLYHELKARAQTLQRAYDELAEADRLKDELVQNVSHELRTPLTFIKGYVELLVSGELGPLETEQHESLKIVLAKTDVLVRLVSDVVSLQAISPASLDLSEVRLDDLARRALAGVEPAAQEAGITLETDFPTVIPPVYADVDRIAQVFDNLLANAIKFSPQGGRIKIRIREEDPRVRVEVEDSGIGIPLDKQQRVFERFYQVDGTTTRRFGGAGLGLAISKQIIEAHRGEIGIARSEPGKGTTFFFTLVAVPSNSAENGIADW
jgi:GAF domain-containing protein/anti-sigma regulatory factor (Ser/Thr protein kinase)